MLLPTEVRTILQERGENDNPQPIVRALNNLEGELGEAYVFVLPGQLRIFSRKIGAAFQEHSIVLTEMTSPRLRDDRPFSYLEFTAAGTEYSLKFSGLDTEHLTALMAAITNAEPVADLSLRPPTLPPTAIGDLLRASTEELELTPIVGFCAAAYAMIQADSSMDDVELEMLNHIISHPPTILKGLDALRRLGTVELFAQLDTLMDEQQKLCVMANLVEFSMIDGLVRGQERKLLQQVKETLGIDQANYDAIFEVLMVKNDRSCFEIKDA